MEFISNFIFVNLGLNGSTQVKITKVSQFEKLEWNKLARAEITSRKYVLSQRRKSPSGKLNSLHPDYVFEANVLASTWDTSKSVKKFVSKC